MYDSVANFTSVIDRLDGLTQDEKTALTADITQELDLQQKFDQQCMGLLSDEERAALKTKDMSSQPYQQANHKLEGFIQSDPACSAVTKESAALLQQNSDLLTKLKMRLSPLMTK
jgi:hypothetical protein